MDYRNILAAGFLLLCGAVFVHSLSSANAFPAGPNVSMGSNPIDSFYLSNCNSAQLFTNNTQQDFIITDIVPDYGGWFILNQTAGGATSTVFKTPGSGQVALESGIKVGPGDSVACTQYHGYGGYISGYYTHT